MNTVVCIKQVVDTEAEKRLQPGDWRLDRTVENILNPYDEYAVEAAIQLREALGGQVTVLCMGPDAAEEAVRKALAMGADQAVMVTDSALEDSDAQGTAYALSRALKTLEFDLVLCGVMSTDAQTGLVPAALAELLDLPVVGNASRLEAAGDTLKVNRQTDEGYIAYECPMPAVVAVAKGINEPRYPSIKGIMGAKKKPLVTMTAADLGIDPAAVGSAGARTRVLAATQVPPRTAGERLTDYGTPAEGA
ncbi:MAG: electron transfer flavoprotein subunit beta/FixA family protein, partial [Thermoleophilia bacterium]|nr:electron transfer flavoprotein subunit beta/FixA family protein [Thermoleophilia bacterium]